MAKDLEKKLNAFANIPVFIPQRDALVVSIIFVFLVYILPR